MDTLARFYVALGDRPDLQERLGHLDIVDEFKDATSAVAAEMGITLSREAIEQAIRVSPIDIAGFMPAIRTRGQWPPLGWLPARSALGGKAPDFDWLWFGRSAFDDPFHRDHVRRFGFRPFGRMTRIRTDLPTLIAGAKSADARGETLAPTGFIFHMSRCGSTLAAQMLAAIPNHIVMSEPEPVDAVVQWATSSGASMDEQVAALRAVVAALGRNRNGISTRYFLKLDAWHGFALPLFRAAFPTTPWVFIFREPGEVLVSLKMEPGIQSAPGGLPTALIGFDPAEATSLDDYTARLFAGLFDRMVASLSIGQDGGGMAVHYPDLVAAMTGRIPTHFGFRPTPAEVGAMTRASHHDAKEPERNFASDTATKRARITPAMASATERWLSGRYESLRRLA